MLRYPSLEDVPEELLLATQPDGLPVRLVPETSGPAPRPWETASAIAAFEAAQAEEGKQ